MSPLVRRSLLACGLPFLLAPPQCHAQTLQSLISLSRDLAAAPPISARGRVNVVETADERRLSICYLPSLAPFSNVDDQAINAMASYDDLAGLLLALEHLNTGNGTIVPELEGLNAQCPLQFYTTSFDTKGRRSDGLQHVIELTDGEDPRQLVPCAILGAYFSDVSIPTSIVSSIRHFPQISPSSTSDELNDKDQHTLFGRTVPDNNGMAASLLELFISWKVDHVAVPYISDDYGNSYAQSLREAAEAFPSISVVPVKVSPQASDAAISQVVQSLKKTQYTYFYAVIYPNELLDRIMTEAHRENIAGTGLHTWLFSISVGTSLTSRNFPPEDPLVDAYRGTGLLDIGGGLSGTSQESYNKLLSSVRQLKADKQDLECLDDYLPQDFLGGKGSSSRTEITSQGDFLLHYGFQIGFLYDAAVGLGLAACALMSSSSTADDDPLAGEELYRAWKNTTFSGTTGPVRIYPETGTRETASSFISLMNYLDSYNSSLGRSFFRETRTAYFHAGTWTQLAPYTFGDGTHQPPLDGPPPPDTLHHLHPGMEAVGYILCVAIVGLSFGFGGWTYHNRKAKVVRASQPIFLYIICVGTAFIGASIIPLTLGPEDGPCQAFPWMLSIGFSLTFSALFTKTYRIKKVMQSAAKFKRLKLTARDVMKPMIALLILNVIILTLWTVIDPQKKRVIDVGPVDDFGYAASTYSICFSEHASIFIAALGVVNLGSVAFALVQAYQARNISTEYSESSYIFRAMAIILYGSFLGAPVLVISGPNIEAYYFVWVGLIFILASSIDVLIFLPKIRTMRKQKENGTPERPQWQRGEDGATRDKTEEKESGIIIYSSKNEVIKKENQRLKKENQELKHLLTLPKNQQLDRVSSVVNRDITMVQGTSVDGVTKTHMTAGNDDLPLEDGLIAPSIATHNDDQNL